MQSKPTVEVCLSPLLFPLFEVKDAIVVVVDILRATSTICVALHHGAEKIIPVASVEEAMNYNLDGCLKAAERHGEKVDGFQLGNSPFEYMNGNIKGKTVILTTTNGTKAIKQSKDAEAIVAGAFSNIDVLVEWLRGQRQNVVLFCAGWKNKVNMEDSLFAGAVASILNGDFQSNTDSTLGAKYLYLKNKENLYQILRHSSHYKRLSHLGVEEDIHYCLAHNKAPVIPILKDEALVGLSRESIS